MISGLNYGLILQGYNLGLKQFGRKNLSGLHVKSLLVLWYIFIYELCARYNFKIASI